MGVRSTRAHAVARGAPASRHCKLRCSWQPMGCFSWPSQEFSSLCGNNVGKRTEAPPHGRGEEPPRQHLAELLDRSGVEQGEGGQQRQGYEGTLQPTAARDNRGFRIRWFSRGRPKHLRVGLTSLPLQCACSGRSLGTCCSHSAPGASVLSA